jgi:hypothetical protein
MGYLILTSWPGLSRAIHAFGCGTKDVDARDKRGHDDDSFCGV